MKIDLYRSLALVSCFDGEGAGDPPAGDPPAGDPPKAFSQDEVNKILAEDKRKHQTQYQKLEKQLQDTLNSAKLTGEERTKLEESLEDVRKQLRTKEETAKLEKKQLEDKFSTQITELTKRAELAENRFVDSTIKRDLQDAAVGGDAFSPSQIVTLLRPMTKMVEDKTMVDFPDISAETGEPIVKQMTPEEAIKRMKQLPETYGNLFKSGVVGGIGAASATGGLTPGQNGQVDPRKLTMDQYLELRKKNPQALGLNPSGRY